MKWGRAKWKAAQDKGILFGDMASIKVNNKRTGKESEEYRSC
jgi:hypothetical protein